MDATTLDWLNALLGDELAAVETYSEALDGRGSPFGRAELWRCLRSHQARVRILHDKIASLGGEPTTSSGLRDAWSGMNEPEKAPVTDDLVLRALALGENQILHDYHLRIPKLDRLLRAFVEHDLLPAEDSRRGP